jgi:transcriptional regulator NrdR family protein
MLPMNCPVCSHPRHRAVVTNSQMADQTVRKRACENCGHVWYTAEVTVPDYVVGWSARHSRKPVLRKPIYLAVGHTRMRASHEEAQDPRDNLTQEANERRSAEADERHRLRQPPLHDAPPTV